MRFQTKSMMTNAVLLLLCVAVHSSGRRRLPTTRNGNGSTPPPPRGRKPTHARTNSNQSSVTNSASGSKGRLSQESLPPKARVRRAGRDRVSLGSFLQQNLPNKPIPVETLDAEQMKEKVKREISVKCVDCTKVDLFKVCNPCYTKRFTALRDANKKLKAKYESDKKKYEDAIRKQAECLKRVRAQKKKSLRRRKNLTKMKRAADFIGTLMTEKGVSGLKEFKWQLDEAIKQKKTGEREFEEFVILFQQKAKEVREKYYEVNQIWTIERTELPREFRTETLLTAKAKAQLSQAELQPNTIKIED